MVRSARPVSARARILGPILIVACVGLAIVGAVTFAVQHERAFRSVQERLDVQTALVADIARNDFGSVGADKSDDRLSLTSGVDLNAFLQAAVERLAPVPHEASFAIAPGSGRTWSDAPSAVAPEAIQPFLADVVRQVQVAHAAVSGTWSQEGTSLRFVATPVGVPGLAVAGIVVHVVDLDAELEPVRAFALTYAIATTAVLLAIAAVGWLVAGRLLSPIRHLRDTADSITLVDLGARTPTDGNDDISDLTRTVNSMLDRLEGSVDVQRQLLDDVRHELKTPITIVRGHLETMDPDDADDVRFARSVGLAELDRMTRLVNDIDLLAAVEGDQFAMADMDLADLTRRMSERVVAIPGHVWTLDRFAHGVIRGDEDRLLQAWLQLADNAAKYTPPDSPIEFGSSRDRRFVRIWMRDHGPGIPIAARHRIFRRFDRAQAKRTVGGSGLGLAIVETIARAHDGRAFVDDTPGGGATFVVELPVAPPRTPSPVRVGDVLHQREGAA